MAQSRLVKEEIVSLYQAGFSQKEIAKFVGSSQRTISRRLLEWGITREKVDWAIKKKEWIKNNPGKIKKYKQDWLERNPNWLRNHQLNRYYGISLEDYNTILKRQNGVCAICEKQETLTTRKGKIRPLSVDHCHESGKIRGLLCNGCNIALGRFEDSPEVLIRAIGYLRDY